MGGLGNQLFQYAAGRALMEQNPGSLLYWHFEDHYPLARRSFALAPFGIRASRANEHDIGEIGPERGIGRRVRKWLNLPIEKNVVRENKTFVYDSSLLERKSDTYLIGFWQSFRYLEPIRSALMTEVCLIRSSDFLESGRQLISTLACPISVHIRRADYLNKSSGFQPLPLTYYEAAIAFMGEHFSDATFLFFTDDPEWIQEVFLPRLGLKHARVISGGGLADYEELQLMSLCRHHVMANSSFSWWGAWLGSPEHRLVIAPKSWNGTDETILLSDLIPTSWMLI